MRAELQQALNEHQLRVVDRAAHAGRSLKDLRDAARGKLDSALLSAVSKAVGKSDQPIARSLAEAHRKLRHDPQINRALEEIRSVLRSMPARLADEQANFYRLDQRQRVAIYQKHTASYVDVAENVTDEEVHALRAIPIDGYTMDEWASMLADQAVSDLRGVLSRGIVGAPDQDRATLDKLGQRIGNRLDSWLALAQAVASRAIQAAARASSESIAAAFSAGAEVVA